MKHWVLLCLDRQREPVSIFSLCCCEACRHRLLHRCPAVARQKEALGDKVMEGVHYIACDADTESRQLCAQHGIKYTPTTQLSSLRIEGTQPRRAFEHAVRTVEAVADHLANTGAVLFGSSTCQHSHAQQVLLGRFADKVPFVDCSVEEARCVASGVSATPTWFIAGQLQPAGLKHLPALAQASSFPGMDQPGDGTV